MELEKAKQSLKMMNEHVGVMEISSGSSSGDDASFSSGDEHEIQQQDPYFSKDFVYTTNVSMEVLHLYS